ncbi:hypothetical protein, conserved [Leishmania tarentolae]|uniref:Uncharacterized protein n=1 Tax=Leishmania tarentolae TaxID=5689 RepID=A0A640KPY2_LEITA|nr:hypothetical protein, conserved [Leishmania tarentolae]
MKSLLKTFRDVVELGEEDSHGAIAPLQHGNLDEEYNPEVLREHISILSQKLACQAQSYEELRKESVSMEKELTRVRLRFAAARKLWESTNEGLDLSIQNLVEHRLFGASSVASARSTTAFDSSTSKVLTSPADTSLLGSTYVASLHEQIQRLKEMVMRMGEERSQLHSEKQFEEVQRVLYANGVSTSHLDAEARAAVLKLVAQWAEERASYESIIENLERNAATHADREALLSDCVKQEQERCAQLTAQNSAAESETLERQREELERWKREEHSAPKGVSRDSPRCSQTAGRISVSTTQRPADDAVISETPVLCTTKDSHCASLENLVGLAAGDSALAEKLQRLSRDCSARDEALDSLYRDNRSLQEAVQQSETRARVCEAELQHCQQQMEELAEQLSREQLRARKLQEERRQGTITEEKLREQVMQLRHAMNTAAARKAAPVASNWLSADMPTTQIAPVRVRLPLKPSILEHNITYEKAAPWKGCAREAVRWWKEFKLNTALSQNPQMHNGMCAAQARGSGVLRRAPRALAMLGGIFAIFMLIYMILLFVGLTRAPRHVRDTA